jgi:transposase
VQLRYSYRLYPDGLQREALARAFGCARVVFNDALAARRAAYAAGEPYIADAALSAALKREAAGAPHDAAQAESSAFSSDGGARQSGFFICSAMTS